MCVTLVVGRVAFEVAARSLDVYLHKKPVELRDSFSNIATTIGRWELIGEHDKLSEAMVEELGTEKYLDRSYALEGDPTEGLINLHIAYYTGMIDAVPHVPDRCFVAAGYNARTRPVNLPLRVSREDWLPDPDHVNLATGRRYDIAKYQDPITGRSELVRMPVGDFALRATEFSDKSSPSTRIFGGYFFIANGRTAVTPGEVKRLAFRKSEEYAYYCKLQFVMMGRRDFDAEQFVAMVADLLQTLLPELMRCLPDWARIEALVAGESHQVDQPTQ